MTLLCEDCRTRLLEGEHDDAVEAHLCECAACRAVELALRDVDADLARLPSMDAPDALVERTLARVESEGSAESRGVSESLGRDVAPEARRSAEEEPVVVGSSSLFAGALAAVGLGLGARFGSPGILVRAVGRLASSLRSWWAGRPPREPSAPAQRSVRGFRWLDATIVTSIAAIVGVATYSRFGNMIKGKIDGSTSTLDAMPGTGGGGDGPVAATPSLWDDLPSLELPSLAREDEEEAARPSVVEPSAVEPWVARAPAVAGGAAPVPVAAPAPMAGLVDGEGRQQDSWQRVAAGSFEVEVRGTAPPVSDPPESVLESAEPEESNGTEIAENERNTGDDDGRDSNADRGLEADRETTRAQLEALGYATDRSESRGRPMGSVRVPEAVLSPWAASHRTAGLHYQSRDGWWQNTYVPGDPAVRLLQAQLAHAGAPIPGIALTPLALAETAAPTTPSISAPVDRAIAVGAHADVASIDGPTRVRVEVALRGIEQAAGRRGALRVAVVIDSDVPLGEQEQARARALIMALSRASGSRDRVMVLASGDHGGTLAELGAARAGRLEVALRRHFSATESAAGEVPVPTTLATAVTAALEGVASPDGAGLVLVLTPGEARSPALEQAIHLGTVAGITTSAVGLGASVDRASLDAIALAGQGRRRMILTDDDATRVVRDELEAASQLVARALRVRIRLAPGVELVDVLGSRPLNAEESRRTREVEQAVDRDLARRLGILADRDQDEEGIRMLLPSFYSGDSHTILLDLVVPRAGHVLDVDVQLKDLVRVGNARASASLTLGSGSSERGPQELPLVASQRAPEVARALSSASDRLAQNDRQGAFATLREADALIVSATTELPTLTSVASVAADRALLDRYLDALSASGPTAQASLARSLSLAAHRRVLRPRLAVSDP